jgi:hypothetical protein
MAELTIADWVNQVPALDPDGKLTGPLPPTMGGVFAGCLALGAAGLGDLIGRLQEVDDGSDYRVRYVLHGLAVYVCAPERQDQRALLCRVLAEAINGPRPAAIRGFLVRQLQVCGTRQEIPALSRLLGETELGADATQAMLAIGTDAGPAFSAAFERLPTPARRALVQALLAAGGEAALPGLRRAADDAEVTVRLTALQGLARLGDRSAIERLLKAADAQGFERIKAAAACLTMAETLIAAKHLGEAQRLYRYLYPTRTEPSERYLRDVAQKGMLAAGFTDPTPPSSPGALTAEAVDAQTVRLSWEPAQDPDSGIWQYAVYRDAEQRGVVAPGPGGRTEFLDHAAVDGVTYVYAVRAVNLGKTESAPTTARLRFLDTVAPRLLTAVCFASEPQRLHLTFSKPMHAAAAGNPAAYALSNGAAVAAVTLSEDGTAADLRTAAPLQKGAAYELTASTLVDRAAQPNALAEPRVTFTVLDLLPGLRYACYEAVLDDDLPAYDRAEPKARGLTPKIDVSVRTRDDQFSLRFDGIVWVPEAGEYSFYTTSDDGSRLYIDGQRVVDNGGPHGPEEKSGTVRLAAGGHRLTVTFFEQGGGESVSAAWQGPSVAKQEIPPAALFHAAE